MEEQVGELWHRLITRMAQTRHPEAAVSLKQVNTSVAVLFRALGGDTGLQVEAAQATEHGARRSLLHRIAGDSKRVELAWRDEQTLRLPSVIDYFPEPQLNRDLYLWLAALAVGDDQENDESWFSKNQRLTKEALNNWPGLIPRYRRLITAHLQQRIQPSERLADERVQEIAIRQALMEPGSVARLPPAKHPPQPVPLWLHPFPPIADPTDLPANDAAGDGSGRRTKDDSDEQKRVAERIKKAEAKNRGLVTIRMENIFTWGNFLNLDRGSEENDDLDSAADAAKEMDVMSISKDAKASAGTLRFDLDLPAAAEDDQVLHQGILLPEWDYKKQLLQPDLCRLVPMLATDAASCPLPERLRKTAKKLRAQFQHLAPARVWQRRQQDGSEIDLDAYLRFATDRAMGQVAADGLYQNMRQGGRDMACLLLADLSLSTDTWINNNVRVIDVIRDSLYLFAESLAATGDAFAMYGFSSRKRDPIRYHQLKTFEEPYTGNVRGRINAIKPGYYTRMGAAIRHSTNLLRQQPANYRLLLILTDGKPNDLDKYEGRYGIEDTRESIREARKQGLLPFCVTIDARGNDYLPHIFGNSSYVVIHKPSQLPKELPLLYARLTGVQHRN